MHNTKPECVKHEKCITVKIEGSKKHQLSQKTINLTKIGDL